MLQPFDPARAALVASWAVGDEVVRAWCAVEGDAVPADVVMGWSEADDVEAYFFAASDGGAPVAYGELWLDDEEGEVELARLLVAPEHRGLGLGRVLVRELVAHARQHPPGASGRDPAGASRERPGHPRVRRGRVRRRTRGRAGDVERGSAVRLPLDGHAGVAVSGRLTSGRGT